MSSTFDLNKLDYLSERKRKTETAIYVQCLSKVEIMTEKPIFSLQKYFSNIFNFSFIFDCATELNLIKAIKSKNANYIDVLSKGSF